MEASDSGSLSYAIAGLPVLVSMGPVALRTALLAIPNAEAEALVAFAAFLAAVAVGAALALPPLKFLAFLFADLVIALALRVDLGSAPCKSTFLRTILTYMRNPEV